MKFTACICTHRISCLKAVNEVYSLYMYTPHLALKVHVQHLIKFRAGVDALSGVGH